MLATPRLAVIFDFDDTLVPDSTTALLRKHSLKPAKFWGEAAKLVEAEGYDPTHAFLNVLIDYVGPGRPLGALSNKALRAFGATLKFFPGVATLPRDLRAIAQKYRVEIDFYIVSGGLEEIILGAPLAKNFTAVYGCRLAEEKGVVRRIKQAITFTEKTRFVFEVNKGITPAQTRKNPYAVNEDVPPEKRPVPFANMIYVGDGLTDIPCFSLIGKNGGRPFGVFNPKSADSARRAFLKLLTTKRTISTNRPEYGPTADLGNLLRAAVGIACSQLRLDDATAS